jgi:Flp pilus assembly protein TadG
MRPRRRCERGSATIEWAIIAPGVLLLGGLGIFAGRVQTAGGPVEDAAYQAARTASLARTQTEANAVAADAAEAMLASNDLDCTSLDVTVNTSGFASPPGTEAEITATVRCTVDVSDLIWIPSGGLTRTLTQTATSPLDTYRER